MGRASVLMLALAWPSGMIACSSDQPEPAKATESAATASSSAALPSPREVELTGHFEGCKALDGEGVLIISCAGRMIQRVSQAQLTATTLDTFSASFARQIDPSIRMAPGTVALSDALTIPTREVESTVPDRKGGTTKVALVVVALPADDGGATIFTCTSASLDTCRADLRALYATPEL